MSSYSRHAVRDYCSARICRWEPKRDTKGMKTFFEDNMEIWFRMEFPRFDTGDCYRFAFPMRHIPDRERDQVLWCFPRTEENRSRVCKIGSHDHLLQHDLFRFGIPG